MPAIITSDILISPEQREEALTAELAALFYLEHVKDIEGVLTLSRYSDQIATTKSETFGIIHRPTNGDRLNIDNQLYRVEDATALLDGAFEDISFYTDLERNKLFLISYQLKHIGGQRSIRIPNTIVRVIADSSGEQHRLQFIDIWNETEDKSLQNTIFSYDPRAVVKRGRIVITINEMRINGDGRCFNSMNFQTGCDTHMTPYEGFIYVNGILTPYADTDPESRRVIANFVAKKINGNPNFGLATPAWQ